VTVANTSSADEDITLSQVGTSGSQGYVTALHDSYFGDVTQTHGDPASTGSVTGSTCGVAVGSLGLGSLQDTVASATNGRTFPQLLAHGTGATPTTDGGKYQCQFDGVLCGKPAPFTNCSFGLSNPDTVSAHLTGDDASPNADTITETDNQFTANVCLVQQ